MLAAPGTTAASVCISEADLVGIIIAAGWRIHPLQHYFNYFKVHGTWELHIRKADYLGLIQVTQTKCVT